MKRLWKILLSTMFILIFIPAVLFAEDGDTGNPISISFKAAVTPQYYEGLDVQYVDVDQPGNSLTVKYDNNTSKVYKYVLNDNSSGWYLDGDISDEMIYFSTIFKNGKVIVQYEVWDESIEDYKNLECSVVAEPYPYPVSISYSGVKPTYYAGYVNIEGFYTEGNKITVINQNNTSDVYICKKFVDNGDTRYEYFLDGKVKKYEDGYYEYASFEPIIPDSGIKKGTTSLKFRYSVWYGEDEKVVTGKLRVKEIQIPYPKSAKFVPAKKSFTASAKIGQTSIDYDALYAKGNKIVVTFSDGSTRDYVAKKTRTSNGNKTTSFIWDASSDAEVYLFPDFTLKKGLKKGRSTVKGSVSIFVWDEYKEYTLPISIKVKTNNSYYAYAAYKTYTYTGKTITPKVTVYVANDNGKMKKLSPSKYTYKAKKGKKIGEYKFNIKIKNKADKKKYGKKLVCRYAIAPKAPTGIKVNAGSGKLTVKWKKQSGIDKFEVLVSKSKNFKNIVNQLEVKKNKTSCIIPDLKKGRTYYVVVRAVKNDVLSKNSKTVSKKTK